MSLFHAGLQPAIDSNGDPISGATWNFYSTGTLTPAAVYADSVGAVSLGAAVTANSVGRFADIFLGGGVTYRAILKDAGGATLADIDPAGDASGDLTSDDLVRLTRLQTLQKLADSIARTGGQLPAVMGTPPTIGAASASTGIATGTSWQLYTAGGVPQYDHMVTLLGGVWGGIAGTAPGNYTLAARNGYTGNGTDPLTNPTYGGVMRFACEAPELELWVRCVAAGSGDGIRVKVNGEYIKTGCIANDGFGLYRYIKLTFGSRAMRYFELDCGGSAYLVGIRTANEYKPMPWPQPDGLRGLIHGDSFVWTVSDSGDDDTGLSGPLGITLRNLLGQSDTIACGIGGAGWMAPVVKDRSWFNDAVAANVVARAPDFIIDHGGGNDSSMSFTQAEYQALVETWLSAVLTAKPETIIFMAGPVIISEPGAQHLVIAAAKQAAAALYPKNVAYLDNFTDKWVFGTGRQGATVGNGNRDWVCGTDNGHPTMEGHVALAGRITRAVSEGVATLTAANLA